MNRFGFVKFGDLVSLFSPGVSRMERGKELLSWEIFFSSFLLVVTLFQMFPLKDFCKWEWSDELTV